MKHKACDILAVDDDQDTIEGLLSEFDLLGYKIDVAETIKEAKSKLRHTHYKVLFVDLRMKIADEGDVRDDGGLDLIRNLRKGKLGPLNQQSPYIIVSAQDFWFERLEAKIETTELDGIRSGRISKFSKGDSLKPLVRKVVGLLESSKILEPVRT